MLVALNEDPGRQKRQNFRKYSFFEGEKKTRHRAKAHARNDWVTRIFAKLVVLIKIEPVTPGDK